MLVSWIFRELCDTRTLGKNGREIEVTDIKNNTTTSYNSISEAAIALNIKQSRISMYFKYNQKKPYKGRYTFNKL